MAGRAETVTKAFYKSMPVMAGYIVLGIGFGILLRDAGYGVVWALIMSLFIYAGSMQYVGVGLLTGGASVLTAVITTIMVNARHLFYSISMIGKYIIPITEPLREVLGYEREYQSLAGIHCRMNVDGYDNFVFLNHLGNVRNQSELNKGLKRIVKACNKKTLTNSEDGKKGVLLPEFTCHILRYTFATRLCEAGINLKVIQEILGHADITTTMNIYTEATKDFKKKEMKNFEEFMKDRDDEQEK